MKKFLSIFLVWCVVLATSWVLFNPKFFRTHDYIHAARIADMTRALEDGHFPVRWVRNFGSGYGMALFNFYAPLPYYAGSLFYWLGFDIVVAVKLLFLVCNIGTAFGAFKLGKKMFGNLGGVLTSAALTLAPYRAVDLFVRGALGEAWAIMFLPWILLGIVEVIDDKKNGWKKLLISLSGLMLSHNLTTMIFAPMAAIFSLLYLIKVFSKFDGNRLKTLLQRTATLCFSVLGAIGFSAFYLLPSFFEKDFTIIDESILGGYFSYFLHFLYIRQFFEPNWKYGGSGWGPTDDISFFLGWGQIIGLTIAVLVFGSLLYKWIVNKRLEKKNKEWLVLTMGLGTLLIISLYMSLFKSQMIWDAIGILKYVQFPWRWLSIGLVFLALVVGSLSLKATSFGKKFGLGMLFLLIIFSNFSFFKPEKFLDNADDLYYADPKRIQRVMSYLLTDYLSKEFNRNVVPASTLITSEYDSNKIEVLVDRTHEKLIRYNDDKAAKVELAIAYFPGWEVKIDQEKISTQVSEDGTIDLTIPEGKHLVEVSFKDTPIRKWSNIVSIFTICLLLWIEVPKSVRKLKNK